MGEFKNPKPKPKMLSKIFSYQGRILARHPTPYLQPRKFFSDQSKYIFIQGFPKDWTTVELQKYFDGTFEVLQDAYLIKDKDNIATGKAILKIPERNIAEFLDENTGTSIGGAALQFRKIDSLESLKFTKNAEDVIKVYVSGVHYGASDSEFKQFVDSIILCDKIEMP